MTAGKLSSTFLLLLLFCIKYGHCGVNETGPLGMFWEVGNGSGGSLISVLAESGLISPDSEYGRHNLKKIKIHVPYYVKHVHHYKKVYVPKIHVIKHEHHHKKEYDHHHHHHEIFKHGPYRSYEKSIHEFPDELSQHDVYYDDIESKSYRGSGRKRIKPFGYRGRFSEQFRGWKDVDGSDYSGEEEDYSTYRKNYYFKRRSGSGEDDDDNEGVEGGDEESEEDEEEEEEDEGKKSTDSTTPVNTELISITTTGSPLL